MNLLGRQPQESSNQFPVPPVQHYLSALPSSPCPLVHPKLPGSFLDRPAHYPPFGEKALRNVLRLREGVVAQEPYNGGHGLNRRLGVVFLPVQDRPGGGAQPLGCLLLGQPQFQPSLPDVLSQGLWLKIGFLWFQCLESDGHELQKSNASLPLRLSRPLQRQMPLHAGSGGALSRQNFRTTHRPD